MIQKLLLVCLSLFSCLVYAQLDSTHYFPPLKQEGNNSIVEQAFYISTPEITPFDIEIYTGNSTIPIILSGLSNMNPIKYTVANGTNDITVVSDANTGIVIHNSGLRFVAPGGQKFYTNYRCKSGAQAGSLTCKGQRALGTDFRWGGIPSVTSSTAIDIQNSLGIMASEDNTVITISGYNSNCTFRQGANPSGLSEDTITITLNAYDSFVLEAIPHVTSQNFEGWLGATISTTKPIAISSVGLTGLSGGTKDLTMDQIVPTDVIGQLYGFIRGNGSDASEFPLIVATKDNTEIRVNGTLYQTINNGDFLIVPGSFYSDSTSGANLLVETNKKVYAYQCLTGETNDIKTIGMNFIPPLSCLLPTNFNHISDISDIAGTPSASSAITVIASNDTRNEDIKVYQNNIEITKPSPINFQGTADWKSFFIDNLSGNIKVISTGNIAVGFFVNDGNSAGYAGYFSGFDSVPDTEIVLVTEGGCLPNGKISIKDTTLTYQWYKDGIIIPGATSYELTLTDVGDYYADIITSSGCVYKSESFNAKYCYDLEVQKTADKNILLEGDQVTYTIHIENKGALPLTNLNISENVPKELLIDSQSSTLGVWNSPNWEFTSLEGGETADLILICSKTPESKTATVTNNLIITYDEKDLDSNTSPDDLEETIQIVNGEIEINTISAELENPYRIVQGDVLNYTFTVRNTGDILLSLIHLFNNIFDFELNEVYVSGDTSSDGILDFDETWLYKTPYNITQNQINKLEVNSNTEAYGEQNNFYNQTHLLNHVFPIDPNYVVPYNDLSLQLKSDKTEVFSGNEVHFKLFINSDDTSDVTDLEILTELPSGFEFVNQTSSIGSYDSTTGIWKIDHLEKNAEEVLKLNAKVLYEGNHTLEAEIMTFNELDSITENNKTSLTITPICEKIFNEFSPNDDGINDYLVVQCDEFISRIAIKIFNRSGTMVYANNNYKNDFNGYGNSGIYINQNKALPNGTYFYVLETSSENGTKKGWIYINR